MFFVGPRINSGMKQVRGLKRYMDSKIKNDFNTNLQNFQLEMVILETLDSEDSCLDNFIKIFISVFYSLTFAQTSFIKKVFNVYYNYYF